MGLRRFQGNLRQSQPGPIPVYIVYSRIVESTRCDELWKAIYIRWLIFYCCLLMFSLLRLFPTTLFLFGECMNYGFSPYGDAKECKQRKSENLFSLLKNSVQIY